LSNVPTNLIPTRITQLPEYLGSSTLGYMSYVIDGRTYKVQFANIAAVGAVPSTREVNTGSGLGGGGDLSANRTLYILPGGVDDSRLSTTGVVAGTYGSADSVPSITVNAQGRVTSVTQTPIVLTGYVPTSRTITAGSGLSGGGDLSANRTFSVNFSSATPEPLGPGSPGVSTVAAREDHVHPAVDLSDTTETQGVLPLSRGGTGNSLSPVVGAVAYSSNDKLYLTPTAGSAGQVLTSAGGVGAPYWQTLTGTGTVTSVDLTAGTGISVSGGPITTAGSITVTNTAPDQIVSLTGAGTTTVTGIYPNFTITSNDAFTGTVTSVNLTAGTGISVSGGPITSSGSITVVNTAPDQIVSLTGAGTTTVTGTYPNFTITSSDAYSGTVTSVNASGNTTGLTFTGGPITTSGTLTLGGTLVVANGGTGATTAAGARTNLGAAASGANSDITSMSGITGSIGTPTYIQFDSGAATPLAAGRLWYDQINGSLNMGMGGGNITQQIGEELFVYGKASAAITDSPLQIIYQTGTVGASGVITFAPTVAGITDGDRIVGVATENIALNGFGRVTSFGVVHGITTNGTAYGETWADGDVIWYNPVTGNPTNIKPVAPNIKVQVGILIKAGNGGSGSIQVEVNHGSVLGGTDSNVQLTAPTNLDLLQYYGAGGYWRNLAPSGITVGTATNLAGGSTNQIAYQTGAGATSFIVAPTVANTFLEWSGSAFQWSANPLGTVTSVNASGGTTGLTFSGGPITTSGTLTLSGTLGVANGGTGATSLAANYLVMGNGTSAVSASNVYQDGSYIGIGTTAPVTLLDVQETLNGQGGINYTNLSTGASSAAAVSVEAGGSYFYHSITRATGVVQFRGVTATTLNQDFNTQVFRSTGGAEYMRITSSGDVGVGTSSPNSKLEVFGGNVRSALASASSATLRGFVMASDSTEFASLKAEASSGETRLTSGFAAFGGFSTFYTNGSERMRIDSAGKVGIGTTAPWELLSVPFNNGIALGSSTYSFKIQRSSSGELVTTFSDTYDASTARIDFTMRSGAAAQNTPLSILGSGNVGIGTSSPSRTLSVYSASSIPAQIESSGTDARISIVTSSGSGGQGFVQASSGALLLGSSNTERMRIDTSGNVGIGTSVMFDKLNVLGAGANISVDTLTATDNNGFIIRSVNTERGSLRMQGNTGLMTLTAGYAGYGGILAINTNGAERMRIDTSGNVTLSAKIIPNVQSVASAATITPNANSDTQVSVTALAVPATLAAPSGTPSDGQSLVIRIKDNGTGRALTWTTGSSGAYRAVGVTLPTTTVANKTVYIGCKYNSTDLRWDVIAVSQEA